jgi:chemotaxis protein MotB
MAHRKKKHPEHEEHENHERWLVSYADMMTLLMAFFVMLFAMSQIDLAKFRKFQDGIATALNKQAPALKGGEGILKGTGGNGSDKESDPSQSVALTSEKRKHDAEVARERRDLRKAQKKIETALTAKHLRSSVRFTLDERGLHVVVVSDKVLFDLGSADLRPEGAKVLDVVAQAVAPMPNHVSVEGHTDNRPISGRYPSNWELSSARASTVVRNLSGRFGINPRRLSASGYADTHPLVPNSTDANRQRNRRVEIVVVSTVDQSST